MKLSHRFSIVIQTFLINILYGFLSERHLCDYQQLIPLVARNLSRDPFPPCFPSYLLSEDKPTGISLDVSGGVVNIVPHDLSLWRNVIRRVEIESITFSKSMKPNKAKPSLTIVFVGGSMLYGHMNSEFINMTKCSQYLNKGPDCPSSETDTHCSRCAYPARFGEWLQSVYPNVD